MLDDRLDPGVAQPPNLRLGAAAVEEHQHQAALLPQVAGQATRVRFGGLAGGVFEQQRRATGMAAEVKDADLVVVIAKRADHVMDGRVVDGRGYVEAGPDERSERLGDRLLLVEQAAQVTLVVDPVVGECQ